MKPADTIGCTFVNTVIGRGIFNHVINLSFGVFNFTPSEADGKIDLDPVVACRLRMDKACAVQLRNALNDLLTLVEEAEAGAGQPAENEKAEGLAPKASEKLN